MFHALPGLLPYAEAMNLTAAFIALAGTALVANLSAFVWGPNLVLLISPTRPIQRSIAYTLGRAIVLTVASIVTIQGLVSVGVGAGRIESLAREFTSAPEPWQSGFAGAVLIAIAAGLWWRPPAFLQGESVGESAGNVGRARLWVSFVLGVAVLFANLLEFAWQGLALTAFVSKTHDELLLAAAVLVWTVVGTADLWGATLVRGIGGQWATDRFSAMTEKLPNLRPWQVCAPLVVVGLGFIAYGFYVWLAK